MSVVEYRQSSHPDQLRRSGSSPVSCSCCSAFIPKTDISAFASQRMSGAKIGTAAFSIAWRESGK